MPVMKLKRKPTYQKKPGPRQRAREYANRNHSYTDARAVVISEMSWLAGYRAGVSDAKKN